MLHSQLEKFVDALDFQHLPKCGEVYMVGDQQVRVFSIAAKCNSYDPAWDRSYTVGYSPASGAEVLYEMKWWDWADKVKDGLIVKV